MIYFQKINGTNLANFEGHIAEIIWRNHCKDIDIYEAFFDYLKEIYPLVQPAKLHCPTILFDSWKPDIPNIQEAKMVPEMELEQIVPLSDIVSNKKRQIEDSESDNELLNGEDEVPPAPNNIDTPKPKRKKRKLLKERLCYPDEYRPLP